MRVLGIVCDTHDSGIALLEDGVPAFVLEEERFNRQKHTLKFPFLSLAAAMEERNLRIGDIDVITTPWDTPQLRRTFATSILARLPASLNLLRPGANAVQNGGVIFLTTWLKYELRRMYGFAHLPQIVQVGHHDAHAAIFFASPFEEAAVLVMDGYGDASATSTYIGSGNRLDSALARRVLRLARHALHLRHLSPGLRAFRGRHRDGARRLRRRHLPGQVQRGGAPRRGWSVRAQSGVSAPRLLRADQPLHPQVPRDVRSAPAGATSPSPTATAIWRSPCRPPPRTWCCTSRARWPQLTHRATCASLEALPSTAWPTPASCATPTTETSGCRPAPPTPARRSAAPCGTTIRPSIAPAPSR